MPWAAEPVVLLTSAARTADAASASQDNPFWKGAHVIINVSALAATPSVVPHIEGLDPAVPDGWYDVLVGAAITATGRTVLKVGPGLTPSPGAAAADWLPSTWRVRMVHGDSDSITYTAAAVLFA